MSAREPIAVLIERFWSRIDRSDGPDACWEWRGRLDAKGYGCAYVGTRYPNGGTCFERAHRVVYRLTKGEVPAGLVVRHSCDNPPCCNPAHLLLGTQGDNTRDAAVQGKYRRSPSTSPWVREPFASLLRRAVAEAPRRQLVPYARRVAPEFGITPNALVMAVRAARKRGALPTTQAAQPMEPHEWRPVREWRASVQSVASR